VSAAGSVDMVGYGARQPAQLVALLHGAGGGSG
jgi:hypothetical protein